MRYKFHDITLYGINNKDFAYRNNLVSSLYIDFLDGYKPKDVTRISVDVGKEDHAKFFAGSILIAGVAFNESEYWLSDCESQYKIILDMIHRIATLCAGKYGWDKAVFEHAYNEVLENGFIYKKELKKKLSKNRRHQASLLLEKNGVFAIISVNFYNSKGEFLKSIELLKTFDDDMFYGKLISNYKWFNNFEFGMHIKNDEIVILASIDKAEPEIILTPVTKTQEKLERYLRQIKYREFINEDDFV